MIRKRTLYSSLLALTMMVPMVSSAQNIQTGNNYTGSNNNSNSQYVYSGGRTYYGSGLQQQQVKQAPQQQVQVNNQVAQVNSNERVASQQSATQVYYIKGSKPCWEEAAAFHNVDPWLLMSIAYVESRFNPNAVNRNKNGSYDTGMMQINSIWFPTLRKNGIDPSLLKDACASTYIGAWILSKNIKQYGYTWRAIGAYNSAKPSLGYKYAKKVYAAHASLIAMRNNGYK